MAGGVPNKSGQPLYSRGAEGRDQRLIELTGELPTALIVRGHQPSASAAGGALGVVGLST